MMSIVAGSVLLLAAADLFATPPVEAYLDPVDAEIARTGQGTKERPYPCSHLVSDGKISIVQRVPTDQCVKMTKPQRWTGVWRAEFEGSQFCPGAETVCTREMEPRIWLTLRDPNWKRPNVPSTMWRVEFIGRRTLYPASYGHMGMAQHEIIVDRFISVKPVE